MKRDLVFQQNSDVQEELARLIDTLAWKVSLSYYLAVASRLDDERQWTFGLYLRTKIAVLNEKLTRFQFGIRRAKIPKKGYFSREICDGVTWMGSYKPHIREQGTFLLEDPRQQYPELRFSEPVPEPDLENSSFFWNYFSRATEPDIPEKHGTYRIDLSQLPPTLAWRLGLDS